MTLSPMDTEEAWKWKRRRVMAPKWWSGCRRNERFLPEGIHNKSTLNLGNASSYFSRVFSEEFGISPGQYRHSDPI
ncbi:helix-turn-helix transcriptional regulator [Larkinella rosea]|uniref:AraC family transcriptional regulator n=1 Tax=Larkinella rosea TaxID=2025312 RepID=A0A3P1BH69_9BACT|nr:AraC family transcriptional regulator [Larkinella rosea]